MLLIGFLTIAIVGCSQQEPRMQLESEIAAAKKAVRDYTQSEQTRYAEQAAKERQELEKAINSRVDRIKADISAQEARLIALNASLTASAAKAESINFASIKSDLFDLKNSYEYDKMVREWDGIAVLKPSDLGFGTIRFSMGTMTVSLGDVTAYASGTKIIISLGNLLSSDLKRVTMKVDFVPVGEDGKPMYGSTVSKEHTVDKITLGSFTNTSVIFDDVKPDKLAFIRIKEVNVGGISMNAAEK